MTVKKALRFKIFKSSTQSWDAMFADAAEFANSVGSERVLNITTSCDHNAGVVTVWYWSS